MINPPHFACIYGLYDPQNPKKIVYVGKTNNIFMRLGYYKKDAYRVKSPVYKWTRSLLEKGTSPCIKILETCRFKNWKSRERRLISIWRKRNPELLNILDGGNGSDSKGIKVHCIICGTERRKLFANDNFRCPKCRPAKRAIYMVSWYSKHIEDRKKYMKEYYKNNPDRFNQKPVARYK